jgi:hypothetical protein
MNKVPYECRYTCSGRAGPEQLTLFYRRDAYLSSHPIYTIVDVHELEDTAIIHYLYCFICLRYSMVESKAEYMLE